MPLRAHDFKGNLLRHSTTDRYDFKRQSTGAADSRAASPPRLQVDPRRLVGGTRAAAGGRHLHQQHDLRRAQPPGHGSHAATPDAVNVIRPLQRGQPAGAGRRQPARRRREGQPVWTPFVTNIDYDAKGQRQRIDYGNGASTVYDYDPLTFRLAHCSPDAMPRLPDDCRSRRRHGGPAARCRTCTTPTTRSGNITHIRDDAQQTIFFRNKRVEPSADYTYDALYRLIEATGREHLGQAGGAPIPHSYDDASARRPAAARRRQRDGHVHRAVRLRRGRQLPGDDPQRQRPGQRRLDAHLRLRRSRA